MLDEFRRHDAAVYAGYLTHNDERLTCTSGGIGTALAAAMLKRGGYAENFLPMNGFFFVTLLIFCIQTLLLSPKIFSL